MKEREEEDRELGSEDDRELRDDREDPESDEEEQFPVSSTVQMRFRHRGIWQQVPGTHTGGGPQSLSIVQAFGQRRGSDSQTKPVL